MKVDPRIDLKKPTPSLSAPLCTVLFVHGGRRRLGFGIFEIDSSFFVKRMFTVFAASAFASSWLSGIGHATDLKEVVQLLESHPRLKAAAAEQRVADAQREAAQTDFRPRIDSSLKIFDGIENSEHIQPTGEVFLRAAHPVFSPGREQVSNKLSALSAAAEAEREIVLAMLVREVVPVFFRAYKLQKVLQQLEANVRQANETVRRVRDRTGLGANTRTDVLRAEMQAHRVIQEKQYVRDQYESVIAELEIYTQEKLTEPLSYSETYIASLQTLKTRRNDMRERVFRAEIDEAGQGNMPELSLFTDVSNSTDLIDLESSWQARAGIQIDWSLDFETQRKQDEISLRRKVVRLAEEEEVRAIDIDQQFWQRRIPTLEARVAANQKILANVKETLDTVTEAFERNEIPFADYSEVIEELWSLERSLLEDSTDLELAVLLSRKDVAPEQTGGGD